LKVKTIQIRNVPARVHRELRSRAALAGMSMSKFVFREIERILERPTREELMAGVARRSPTRLSRPPAELVREVRPGNVSEAERRRMLAAFDELVGRIPPRPASEVSAEIRGIRAARRKGGRKVRPAVRRPRAGE
jgi:antitoxin FitA